MKIQIFLIVSLLVVAGCGGLEPPVINTEGNTYSSSKMPSIQIEFPVDFEYLGSMEKYFQVQTTGGTERTLKAKNNTYFYGSITNDNFMKKLIVISVLKLRIGKYWTPQTLSRLKNPLKRDIVKLGTRNFQYGIIASRTTRRFIESYLLDKGITTPTCNMSMVFGRVFSNNVKMYIRYYEDISNFKEVSNYPCEAWFEKEMFHDNQKEYLKEFETRALNSIKVQ